MSKHIFFQYFFARVQNSIHFLKAYQKKSTSDTAAQTTDSGGNFHVKILEQK
jgi:hypothetical protein